VASFLKKIFRLASYYEKVPLKQRRNRMGFIDDAKDKLDTVIDDTKDKAAEISEDAKNKAEDVKVKAEEGFEDLKGKLPK
jgi:ElaB/YqjD/DUF883 family membrane-anchored ribosome-binding protein